MEDDVSEEHNHCKTCFRIKCIADTDCPVIPCPLRCGAKFHTCKLDEHKDSCGLEKVECINSVNGCPLIIQRNKLGSHLQRCPASVVYCTMEWNRWPVYSHERQSRVPFVADNWHAQYGQLDVALALRDQRMLNQAMKAPRSTRRALRNNLTQRFPAVPIRLHSSSLAENSTSGSSSQTGSSEDIEVRKNLEYPPGLEKSICNALFKASRSALEKLKSVPNPNDGDIANTNAAVVTGTEDPWISDYQHSGQSEIDASLKYCTASEPNLSFSETIQQPCTIHQEANIERFPEESKCDISEVTSSNSNQSDIEVDNSAGPDHEDDGMKQVPQEIPDPPCSAPTMPVKETLALDLNLESITRYQAKPRSMYTFLCAQEFRRDEYSSHFKNIHDGIHSGLNGWLEQRCPLSQYGCTYSIRRMYAGEKGNEIVHNDILESFGIKPQLTPLPKDSENLEEETVKDKIKHVKKMKKPSMKYDLSNDNTYYSKDDENEDDVTELILNRKNSIEECSMPVTDFDTLPFEVVRYIASFLDGYSLCNIALTSRRLREVACSLLEEKGIVVQQWEKIVADGQPLWQISHKRWIFSTAFSSIKKWGFEDYTPLGDHLRTCPFYHRAQQTVPHNLPSMKCGQHHSDNFCETMRRMYPDFTVQYDDQEPACTAGAGLC